MAHSHYAARITDSTVSVHRFPPIIITNILFTMTSIINTRIIMFVLPFIFPFNRDWLMCVCACVFFPACRLIVDCTKPLPATTSCSLGHAIFQSIIHIFCKHAEYHGIIKFHKQFPPHARAEHVGGYTQKTQLHGFCVYARVEYNSIPTRSHSFPLRHRRARMYAFKICMSDSRRTIKYNWCLDLAWPIAQIPTYTFIPLYICYVIYVIQYIFHTLARRVCIEKRERTREIRFRCINHTTAKHALHAATPARNENTRIHTY